MSSNKLDLADTFNLMWQGWFISLQEQMPQITMELNDSLALLETASQLYREELIQSFASYTQCYLSQLFAEDELFLVNMAERASHSQYSLMPDQFLTCFRQLDAEQKKNIWGTLKRFAKETAKYDENYAKDFIFAYSNQPGKEAATTVQSD